MFILSYAFVVGEKIELNCWGGTSVVHFCIFMYMNISPVDLVFKKRKERNVYNWTVNPLKSFESTKSNFEKEFPSWNHPSNKKYVVQSVAITLL